MPIERDSLADRKPWCFLVLLAALATTSTMATEAAVEVPEARSSETDDGKTAVEFPDAALRKAVEEALGNAPTDPITRGQMATLRTLIASGVGQLAGIEYAANLRWLFLRSGTISNLAPLSGLTALTRLDLWDNSVSDVTPLSSLTSLIFLNLGLNAVEDVSSLSGLTSLTSLTLRGSAVYSYTTHEYSVTNPISEVTSLSGLTSLTFLDLSHNAVGDVSPLSGLKALTQLDLSNNAVRDISPLSGLTSLTRLSLGLVGMQHPDYNQKKPLDLSPLADLTDIEDLYLSRNHIWDLSPLAGLTSLMYLSLESNYISDLGALAGLTSLRTLGLKGNVQIVDLTPLDSLTSLTALSLGDCGQNVRDVSPLAGLMSLRRLHLGSNGIADLSPLLRNTGLGDGDIVDVRLNPLTRESVDTVIPQLVERGVEVWFEPPELPEGWETIEIADAGLRAALERALLKGEGWWIAKEDLRRLHSGLVASDFAIHDLTGIEVGGGWLSELDLSDNNISDLTPLADLAGLRYLFLDGNDINDVGHLGSLSQLAALTLSYNTIEDVAPLAALELLTYLALDGNSIADLPTLPANLRHLHLTNNEITDIAVLAGLRLIEVRLGGNAITSLAPLAGQPLRYLHLNSNKVADISPLNLTSLRELHMANNAVRDITPLLQGEELLMADVRRNPLADDALDVLETLRERRLTVLAGETVPYFPAAGQARQGFVRVINRGDEAGHAFIEAVDDAGVRAGPVRLEIGARRAVHFNSRDLQNGNAAKGLSGGVGAPTAGDWRLSVISALDLEVLSYIRTGDGFVTAMHDVAADAMAPFFNPGGNVNQRSILRQVNMEAEPAKWTAGGYDDAGKWRPMAGSLLVRPQHALTLTAQALENDHGMGDGRGKWRLRVRGFPWYAMSLLESPTGHLTNLSTAPDNAMALADGRTMHRLPLFPAAGGSRQGFVRVINRSYSSGEVVIEAVDDAGMRSGPVRLTMRPRRAVHFNSMDLEAGNADKGLDGGLGVGQGDWRLKITSELDLMALSYIRTTDGFLTSMHDLAPIAEDGSHRVVFFNPGRNERQVSRLRLINDGDLAASATITGVDDHGNASGTVSLTVPAGSALTFAAAELETGDDDRLAAGLGNPAGRWRLRVRSDEPIAVMSLLETPTGHLTNLSTTPRHPPRPNDQY